MWFIWYVSAYSPFYKTARTTLVMCQLSCFKPLLIQLELVHDFGKVSGLWWKLWNRKSSLARNDLSDNDSRLVASLIRRITTNSWTPLNISIHHLSRHALLVLNILLHQVPTGIRGEPVPSVLLARNPCPSMRQQSVCPKMWDKQRWTAVALKKAEILKIISSHGLHPALGNILWNNILKKTLWGSLRKQSLLLLSFLCPTLKH